MVQKTCEKGKEEGQRGRSISVEKILKGREDGKMLGARERRASTRTHNKIWNILASAKLMWMIQNYFWHS